MDQQVFVQNREKAYDLLKSIGGVAVLKGFEETGRPGSDYEYPFRQESSFYYLSGANEAGAWIVWDLVENSFHLFLTILPESFKTWMKVESLDDKKKKYSAPYVHSVDDLPVVVADLLKKGRNLFHALEITSAEDIRKVTKIGDFVPIDRTNLQYLIGESRVTKTPGEIAVMRKVCGIATQAHIESMKRVREGMVENELDALYHFFTKKIGGINCLFQSFYPIASFATSSSTLHHWAVHLDKDVVAKDGDFAMLDAGVEYSCYAADITRTFPISGKFSERQKTIYNIVLAAHDAIFEQCKPGVNTEDIQRLSMRITGDGLIKVGLITGVKDADEAIEKDLVALFYPHGFGHMLGLDVHDVNGYPRGVARIQKPGFRSLRTRRALQVGMITTDEPGIYFHPETLLPALSNPLYAPYLNAELIKSYLDFGGIRIEDDVLITPAGGEYLTTVPRTVDDIEALLVEGRKQLGDKWSL